LLPGVRWVPLIGLPPLMTKRDIGGDSDGDRFSDLGNADSKPKNGAKENLKSRAPAVWGETW